MKNIVHWIKIWKQFLLFVKIIKKSYDKEVRLDCRNNCSIHLGSLVEIIEHLLFLINMSMNILVCCHLILF